jgi:hypothetical protein
MAHRVVTARVLTRAFFYNLLSSIASLFWVMVCDVLLSLWLK